MALKVDDVMLQCVLPGITLSRATTMCKISVLRSWSTALQSVHRGVMFLGAAAGGFDMLRTVGMALPALGSLAPYATLMNRTEDKYSARKITVRIDCAY